jgi:hypothetical protein
MFFLYYLRCLWAVSSVLSLCIYVVVRRLCGAAMWYLRYGIRMSVLTSHNTLTRHRPHCCTWQVIADIKLIDM